MKHLHTFYIFKAIEMNLKEACWKMIKTHSSPSPADAGIQMRTLPSGGWSKDQSWLPSWYGRCWFVPFETCPATVLSINEVIFLYLCFCFVFFRLILFCSSVLSSSWSRSCSLLISEGTNQAFICKLATCDARMPSFYLFRRYFVCESVKICVVNPLSAL